MSMGNPFSGTFLFINELFLVKDSKSKFKPWFDTLPDKFDTRLEHWDKKWDTLLMPHIKDMKAAGLKVGCHIWLSFD